MSTLVDTEEGEESAYLMQGDWDSESAPLPDEWLNESGQLSDTWIDRIRSRSNRALRS